MTTDLGETMKRIGAWCVGLVVLCLAVLVGCSTIFADAEARQAEQEAYQMALDRQMQGHIYEMGCPALLPLAEEMLLERDYEQVDTQPGATGLHTGWNQDEQQQYRLEVVARRVGADRCSVQVVERRRGRDGVEYQERNAQEELELLEAIDESEAERVRSNARRDARRQVNSER